MSTFLLCETSPLSPDAAPNVKTIERKEHGKKKTGQLLKMITTLTFKQVKTGSNVGSPIARYHNGRITTKMISFRPSAMKSLRKHAYLNTLKISLPKTESFQTKILIFLISAKNIYCRCSLEPPHRGGSNEYTQYMFLSRNKKNNVYPCKPQFYYIKVGFKGVKII